MVGFTNTMIFSSRNLKREATLKWKQNSCQLNKGEFEGEVAVIDSSQLNAAAALRRSGVVMREAAAMLKAAVMKDAVISERWERHQRKFGFVS